MSNLSKQFLDYLENQPAKLAKLVKINYNKSQKIFATQLLKSANYKNHYIEIKNIEKNLNNLSFAVIKLGLDNQFKEDFIDNKYYEDAEIDISLALIENNEIKEELSLFTGFIEELAYDLFVIHIFAKSKLAMLKQDICKYYSRKCRANFADSKCGVDITKYQQQFIIDEINNTELSLKTDQDLAAYNNGYLVVNNQSYRIAAAKNNKVSIYNACQFLDKNQQILLKMGCDKTASQCTNKYNNIINFRGEPFIAN